MSPRAARRPTATLACALLALVAGIAPLAATATASAQSTEQAGGDAARARAYFEEGVALSDRGEYDAAVDRFRRSLELVERPSTLFNLGVALRELGRSEEAARALERFLELADESVDASARAQAEEWLRAIRATIGPSTEPEPARSGTLRLELAPADALVTIDGMEIEGPSPIEVDLEAGTHRVDVTAPDHEPAHLDVAVEGGAHVERSVSLSPVTSAPPEQEMMTIAGWTAIGLGVASLIGAIAATIVREDQVSTFDGAACAPSTWGTRADACPELRARIDTSTGLEATAWIATGLFGGAGALLVLLAPVLAPSSSPGSAAGDRAVSCGPGTSEIGVACAGRF